LTKRLHGFVIIAVVLLVPSLILGASNEFRTAKAVASAENTITVPLEITNTVELSALDIPLKFNDGVRLIAVEFEDTRVSYFDIQAANIDNDNKTVVIGLLPQISANHKPALQPGSGEIARLVFEIVDPQVEAITIEATTLENPNHSLAFVYVDRNQDGTQRIQLVEPEFNNTTVALSGVGEAELPSTFALQQNYPNPFNPVTQIAFDLPQASQVELSVYNVLGQKVVTLVNREVQPGSYVSEWDGRNNSSGIYFYRLTADSFTATKKMMMLK